MLLCQVSSGTVEFDRSEGTSANESKLAEFSLADFLSGRIDSLVKYLDRRVMKYSVPASSAGSYVELVRRRTKPKTPTSAEIIEQVASLTSSVQP